MWRVNVQIVENVQGIWEPCQNKISIAEFLNIWTSFQYFIFNKYQIRVKPTETLAKIFTKDLRKSFPILPHKLKEQDAELALYSKKYIEFSDKSKTQKIRDQLQLGKEKVMKNSQEAILVPLIKLIILAKKTKLYLILRVTHKCSKIIRKDKQIWTVVLFCTKTKVNKT